MDPLTLDDLRGLLEGCEGKRVSLFMPTHGAAPDNRQDLLQFRALLREAEDSLVVGGMRPADAAALLSPARDLAEDGMFWRPRPGGLAVFVCPEGMRAFRTPEALGPGVSVGDRFAIRPVLTALDRGERFFVIALSQHSVRLFRGTREALTEIDLGDMPRDILEALRVDGFEEQLQSHSGSRGSAPDGGRGAAIFHGSGADTGITTRYLTEYAKRIAAGLADLVRDREAPFVIAAVSELAALYREADRRHNIVPGFVAGNPEATPVTELHSAAWAAASESFDTERLAIERRYRENLGSAAASEDPSKIVPAAAYGRVAALLVSPDASLWGRFDEATGTVEISDGTVRTDEDLIELAVLHTILHGGEVHVATLGDPAIGAVMRY